MSGRSAKLSEFTFPNNTAKVYKNHAGAKDPLKMQKETSGLSSNSTKSSLIWFQV